VLSYKKISLSLKSISKKFRITGKHLKLDKLKSLILFWPKIGVNIKNKSKKVDIYKPKWTKWNQSS